MRRNADNKLFKIYYIFSGVSESSEEAAGLNSEGLRAKSAGGEAE